MSKKKILVLAPHPDDEVLGLGGYLLHESEKGSDIQIVFATSDGSDERYEECAQVMQRLRPSLHFVLYRGMDGRLSQVDMSELIGKIDEIVYAFEPDELFVCYPSHHQDHKTMYEATMASCRMKQFFVPPAIYLYEYPFVPANLTPIPGGKVYFPLSLSLAERKVELFSLYKSQQKEFPSPLNAYGIDTLARTRGLECGHLYAECFYLQKMILK